MAADHNKSYEVITSSRAVEMLTEHVAFLSQVSAEAALALAADFVAALMSLQEMPQRCPFLREEYLPKNKYRKLIVKERYLLLFQVIEDTVYVDFIMDCRQDYEWLLK